MRRNPWHVYHRWNRINPNYWRSFFVLHSHKFHHHMDILFSRAFPSFNYSILRNGKIFVKINWHNVLNHIAIKSVTVHRLMCERVSLNNMNDSEALLRNVFQCNYIVWNLTGWSWQNVGKRGINVCFHSVTLENSWNGFLFHCCKLMAAAECFTAIVRRRSQENSFFSEICYNFAVDVVIGG